MRKFGLAAFATAALLWAAPASAVSFTIDWDIDTNAMSDPGLVIGLTQMAGTLNFDLSSVGQKYSTVIAQIGTNESSIQNDDLAQKNLDVNLDVKMPTPGGQGVVDGYTTGVGYGIFGAGVLDFISPITLTIGSGIELLVTFSDAVFALNNPVSDFFFDRSADIKATFELTKLSTVPVPPALALFGSGLVGMALLARRRKPKTGALQA